MEIVLFIDENQSNTFFLVTDRKEMHKRKQTNHKQRIKLKKNSVSLPPFLKEKIYNWRKNFLFRRTNPKSMKNIQFKSPENDHICPQRALK